MEPVIIVWADAWGEDKQAEIADLEHYPIITHSVGWLIKQDEVGITIAGDTYPESPTEVRNTAFIPRGMVREVRFLSEQQ